MMVLGQESRQTTSNLGHLQKPSIQVCTCLYFGNDHSAGLLLISSFPSSAFSQLAFALEVSVSNSRLTIAFGRLEKRTLFIQAQVLGTQDFTVTWEPLAPHNFSWTIALPCLHLKPYLACGTEGFSYFLLL